MCGVGGEDDDAISYVKFWMDVEDLLDDRAGIAFFAFPIDDDATTFAKTFPALSHGDAGINAKWSESIHH